MSRNQHKSSVAIANAEPDTPLCNIIIERHSMRETTCTISSVILSDLDKKYGLIWMDCSDHMLSVQHIGEFTEKQLLRVPGIGAKTAKFLLSLHEAICSKNTGDGK